MNNIKPNPGKQIDIIVHGKTYSRYPIKTEVFKNGDDYGKKIADEVAKVVSGIFTCHAELVSASQKKIPNQVRDDKNNQWYIIVSEKIVAISQGRSYFIKDIKPSWVATMLSKYVRKTPHGIGLGSPWTMQLAIGEVGLPRILLASVLSILTKPFGLRGVFYHVAGREAAAIDGPTEYSLYPSNVSAKLAPKDPQKAAEKIRMSIQMFLSSRANQSEVEGSLQEEISRQARNDDETFAGVVIIDANDLGRNVLGNATDKPDSFFEEVMRDNPMGQGSEQTPVVIIV